MSELANGFDASIVDQKASKVGPAGIDLAYQRLGNPSAPLALLIMGLGAQSIHWPDAFCHALVDLGLQVVRFDNRDSGLSTHLTDAPPPDLPAALAGDLSSVSYTLSDMAADAAGLLDVLGFKQAHVVGASMGGAIAQTMAIEHPDRVRSLTSLMSTTGNMSVGQPSSDVLRAVFAGPPATTRDEVIQRMVQAFRAVGSPGYPADEKEVAARGGRAYDRSYDPIGVARQAIASVASGDRTERLRHLAVPALVIHGLADRM
ncbi:MAG TPA: alpha/beta hydrolase, partial [Bryobacteraceae bacterium]|nr:alpha/beta hydrolase [Bryobacteraceae bacterium]